MATFSIQDEDLAVLKGKVIVITGGSSGIGLATTKLLLSLGAAVISGDVIPSPLEDSTLSFVKTDVSQWADLVALFKHANDLHGRIDHVFANAGINNRANYVEDRFDDSGNLLEPSFQTLDINLRGAMNTSYLGMHYMRKQQPAGGSIVITASASSFQRFRIVDYVTAKHGVLGFMRGLVPAIKAAGQPIRVNSLAPDWTATSIIPQSMIDLLGDSVQGPEVVAKAAAVCMADESRQGQLIYTKGGAHRDVEESILMEAAKDIIGRGLEGDDATVEAFLKKLAAEIETQNE